MIKKSRNNNLYLYACLIRKYYIGEDDYLSVTLNKIPKVELLDAWNYALKNVKHDERVKNALSIPLNSFDVSLNRFHEFKDQNEIINYLKSDFNPANFKLSDENAERRLRYLLTIKTLKYLEQIILGDFYENELRKKISIEEKELRHKLKNELDIIREDELQKTFRFKRYFSFFIYIFFTLLSIGGFYTYKYVKELKEANNSFLKINEIQQDYLKLTRDSLKFQINALKNEDYLNKLLNENKFKRLKEEGFTGNIFFEPLYEFKSVSGYLSEGKERRRWIYVKYDGEKEVYEWMWVRVGALCNDGTQSYSTGSGTCSYHGGVSEWLHDYQKILIE